MMGQESRVHPEQDYYQQLLAELLSGKRVSVTDVQMRTLNEIFGAENIPENITVTPTSTAAVNPEERAGGNS